jgi:gas vesicle protein
MEMTEVQRLLWAQSDFVPTALFPRCPHNNLENVSLTTLPSVQSMRHNIVENSATTRLLFASLDGRIHFLEKCLMRRRKQNTLLNLLLGTGAYLLYSMRDRLGDIEDLGDRARKSYETASRRLDRTTDALRGRDHHALSTATALLMGAGAGVGIGMLFAPARGQKIRADISQRARESYETASRRIGRASDALRGQDHHAMSTATALLMGVGAGVGIGMLFAPASGQKTRADVSEKVKDVREKIRVRSSKEPQGASATYGR